MRDAIGLVVVDRNILLVIGFYKPKGRGKE